MEAYSTVVVHRWQKPCHRKTWYYIPVGTNSGNHSWSTEGFDPEHGHLKVLSDIMGLYHVESYMSHIKFCTQYACELEASASGAILVVYGLIS